MLGVAKRLNCAEINSNYSSTAAVGEFRNVGWWLSVVVFAANFNHFGRVFN
jgi:hypothetical protein